MDRIRDDSLELNEEVQRIYELLGKVSDQELRRMAKLLAVTGDHELFGQTELELRDRVQPPGGSSAGGSRRGATQTGSSPNTGEEPFFGWPNIGEPG